MIARALERARAVARTRYWRRTRRLVVFLLAIWAAVTFVIAFFARDLSSIDFLGFPFPYWVGAQGALLLYLLITVVFALIMNRIDASLDEDRHDSR